MRLEMRHQTLRLRGGRNLGFAEYGRKGGAPLVFLHGFPGARLFPAALDEAARNAGVRLIAPERPGHGLSDVQEGRGVADFVPDVLELMDALQVARFAALGFSGGGPYALALGALARKRVTRIGVVSGTAPRGAPLTGMNPLGRGLSALGRAVPALQGLMLGGMARGARRDPQAFMRRAVKAMPAPDKALFADELIFRATRDDLLEAFRQGARGPALDAVAQDRGWGFSLADVGVPASLWHGEEDASVPISAARFVAARLPNVRATFLPGEAHFSCLLRREAEVFSALVPEAVSANALS